MPRACRHRPLLAVAAVLVAVAASTALSAAVSTAAEPAGRTRMGPDPASRPHPRATGGDFVGITVSGSGQFGQPMLLTSQVTDRSFSCDPFLDCNVPTGTVMFSVDGISYGRATLQLVFSYRSDATLSIAGLDIGQHTVTAEYEGDDLFFPNTATSSFTVGKGPCTASLGVFPTSNVGASTLAVSFTASVVGGRGGTVAFYDSADNLLGQDTLTNQNATFQTLSYLLPSGDTIVHAVYGGDDRFEPCRSNTAVYTVVPPSTGSGGVSGPRLNPDTATTPAGVATVVAVLENDTDMGSGTFESITISTAPLHGTAVLTSNLSIRYTPEPGFVGRDYLTYLVTNSSRIGASTQLSIDVVCAPSSLADRYPVAHDAALTIAAPGVLANDTACGATAVMVDPPASGSLDLAANGSFTFAPARGSSGQVPFTYRLSTGQVPITVLLDIAAPVTAPTTIAPTTIAPTTVAPTTIAPTTVRAPNTSTTNSPTTTSTTTTTTTTTTSATTTTTTTTRPTATTAAIATTALAGAPGPDAGPTSGPGTTSPHAPATVATATAATTTPATATTTTTTTTTTTPVPATGVSSPAAVGSSATSPTPAVLAAAAPPGITSTTTTPIARRALPATGGSSASILWFALVCLVIGSGVTRISRRRPRA